MSDTHWLTFRSYLRWKAVGRFPVDGIVERNAGVIRLAEDQLARAEQVETLVRLALIMGAVRR